MYVCMYVCDVESSIGCVGSNTIYFCVGGLSKSMCCVGSTTLWEGKHWTRSLLHSVPVSNICDHAFKDICRDIP